MKYRFMRFPEFKTKAVTFSYDDGVRTDKNVIEILDKYGFSGTFNIHGKALERTDEEALTKDEFLSIYEKHEVANHGRKHTALIKTVPIDGISEVLEGRMVLEKFYKKIIRGFAYPDIGKTNDEIKAYLKMLGVSYARTTKSTHSFNLPADWLEWDATCKHDDEKLMELCEEFINTDPKNKYVSSRDSILFYVWGHSWELDGRWHVLEDFCKKLSGENDIWKATNMEIYEYVNAYSSLVFSADNKIVHNPTHFTVYYEEDKENKVVKPGETIIC